MIGNIAFTIMLLFQLSGALILLFGNLKLNLSYDTPQIIYGDQVDAVAKKFTKNAYKTMYVNRAAGIFLTIGYTASIWADLNVNSLFLFALIVVVLSLLFSYAVYKLIEKLSDKKAQITATLPVGTTNID